jgi:hypothetical protein
LFVEAPVVAKRPEVKKKDVPTTVDCMFMWLISVPDKSKVRSWSDKSGSFNVEAQYIGLVDGKVQLHKLNGVKIMVPLDKLACQDSSFVLALPGNEKIGSGRKQSMRPKKAVEIDASALVKASQDGGRVDFTYNGFDWCSWLIAAGVESVDAKVYAKKFVEQKMDKAALIDLEREVLRVLGVAEGDIIRIRRAVGSMPGVSSQTAQREKKAHDDNMLLLGTFRKGPPIGIGGGSPSFPTTFQSSKAPSNFQSKAQQLLSDEAYARRLQDEENRAGGRGMNWWFLFGSYKSCEEYAFY